MRFNFEGVRIDQSTGFENKKQAEAYAEAYRTKLRNEGVGLLFKEKKDVPTFKLSLNYFYKFIERRLEPSTVRRYKLAASILLKFFGTKRLDKITPNDIEKFVTKRSEQFVCLPSGKIKKEKKKVSASTVNKELAVLKKLFNVHINTGVINLNPVCAVKFLKEKYNAGRVLNYAEEELYLKECTQPYQDFATILIETGMRPNELCGLKINDVDLGRKLIYVIYGKTSAATRTIPISNHALTIIEKRMSEATGLFLFAGGARGNDPNSRVLKFNNSHYGALRRSKIDSENRIGTSGRTTIYSFRHTFATRFVEAGGDLVTLAKLLGHSGLKMIMRYAHPSDAHAVAAINKMSQRGQDNSTKASKPLMQKKYGQRHLTLVKNAA